MSNTEKLIRDTLFSMRDEKYREFQCKLMPTVDPETVIGVRTPDMRKFAKSLFKMPERDDFLNTLPHKYYEENNLHGFLTEMIKDYDEVISRLDAFLPYVDNWATCDMMRPKVFKRNREKLLTEIYKWINSKRIYTVRFAIGMLMSFYLDEGFKPEYLETVSAVKSDEYYVNMMIAWYFATALAKQPESTICYIENHRLDPWVHNKAIQKAIESYRVSGEMKEYLRTLKIKKEK